MIRHTNGPWVGCSKLRYVGLKLEGTCLTVHPPSQHAWILLCIRGKLRKAVSVLIVTFSDKRTKCCDIFEMVRHIQNLIGHHEVLQLIVVNLHV